MEPTGKIVEYCAYAWKLALRSIGENIDDDDVDMDEKSRNEGKISTVIPIIGDLGQSGETTWKCSIWRYSTRDSNGREITGISVGANNFWGSEVFIEGFYKISITDETGNILPGQMKYARVSPRSSDDDDE